MEFYFFFHGKSWKCQGKKNWLQRGNPAMASTESCGVRCNGLNDSCLFTRIVTPPPDLSGRFFLRIFYALNLTRQDYFRWGSLRRTISGLTKDRKCRNFSRLALVSPLAFHWAHIKLLDGFGVERGV